MIYYVIKVITSAILIVAISEISKKNSFVGSIFASLPLISIFAFIWLYVDTGNVQKVIDLSKGIFWMVIPSLSMFIVLPYLLQRGMNFYYALAISIIILVILYFIMVTVISKFGIKL